MRSDQELMAQVASNERETAVAELIRRYGVMIERTVRRLIKDGALADDVCQAVMMVAVQKAGELKKEGSLGGWLHRTAVLVARNALREESRRKMREREAARRLYQPRTESRVELPEGFDDALAGLPATYREVLVMRYLEGRSRGEIAAALKMKEGAVDVRISRGVERLRKALVGTAGVIAVLALTQALATEASAAGAATLSAPTAAALVAAGSGKAGSGRPRWHRRR